SERAKELKWSPDAMERLEKIPAGFMRDMTRWRIEKMARQKDLAAVTLDLMQDKYDYWAEGSAKVQKRLPWTKEAEEKVLRIPPAVRGMVIKEIEALAEKRGLKEVPPELLAEAKEKWGASMEFHSDPDIKGEEKAGSEEFLGRLKEEIFSHEAVNHPFLERFSKGGLTVEQVNTFAIHYYQHAKMFSHYIANIIPKIPHEWDRMLMVKNLMDEYGNLNPEKTHPALFRKFLMALGLEKKDWKKIEPIPEVTNFVDRLTMLTRHEPFLIGLGAVGPGVEWVIPAMFTKIVEGLKKSISLKEDEMEYWTSHIILDVEHGEAATKILTNYLHGEDTEDMVRKGAMKSLEARKILWDGFERLLGF
ncbi:MAG: iron-containing redox enzyme family protein, partial [Deltaproteobacteria bacterium]|nr:iron-containing redox enzyme family protein [Deltaproteobacteria bacterium]